MDSPEKGRKIKKILCEKEGAGEDDHRHEGCVHTPVASLRQLQDVTAEVCGNSKPSMGTMVVKCHDNCADTMKAYLVQRRF